MTKDKQKILDIQIKHYNPAPTKWTGEKGQKSEKELLGVNEYHDVDNLLEAIEIILAYWH